MVAVLEMNALGKTISIFAYGLGFLLVAVASSAIGWSLLFFGPRSGDFASLALHVASLPYTIFFSPAFLIPPDKLIDSTWGVILITAILVGFWGVVIKTVWFTIRKHVKSNY